VRPHVQFRGEGLFSGKKIRCVLAHDHVLLRQGVRRLLEDEPDLEVVAEAGNADEALEMVSEQHPEVVITDANVFGLAADQVEQMILQESPESKVLFLTMSEGEEPLQERQGEGAQCAARQTSAEDLAAMVRRAGSAGTAVVREMLRRGRGEWAAEEPLVRKQMLTAREREVLKLLAGGRTVRSAAAILGLSVKTVDAHKFNLMRKLGIHNKAELVMWAIRERVVKVPANL
jgi:two-component system response regulator NreC